MHVIDGKSLAEKMRADLKREIVRNRLTPRLAILLVGDDPASRLYVDLKKKAADDVGIRVDVHHLPSQTPDEELVDLIETWNADPSIHGILVQIPLPPGHDEQRVINTIDPKKDADGFHPQNVQALLDGRATVIPPVHEGILRLINEAPLKLQGASAVIIANSDVFATPLKKLLSTAGLFVHVMSPDDLDVDLLSRADVVVIAIGRLAFLHPSMTKPDAVIIDVGTNKAGEKTRGDADLEAYEKTDAWITPVPGGVGPMTIVQLLKNVTRLAQPSSPSGSEA